ncbi:phosphonopyruvate decarboxylase [Streptomyces dioscori]|uniref:Phosphonopyruvate decarboxylase n=2 Tax=Streptomyces dioscori TaxID=2109333 RepID=A0A2P8Q4F5_9ACTN|nr:phosphonopyruvate decarboxylase [Streptomyces dioscori]
MPYGIGVVVFMSLRGWPDPRGDEPQHAVMGHSGHALLDALGVAHWTLDGGTGAGAGAGAGAGVRAGAGADAGSGAGSGDAGDTGGLDDAARVLDAAVARAGAGEPAFVLVPRGTFGSAPGIGGVGGVGGVGEGRAEGTARAPVSRTEAVRLIAAHLPPATAVVATTGYTSRDLCAAADRDGSFYMQGSMGHASALGLGLAASMPRRPVLVLDGDGAALMHLGTLSTIGAEAPENLVHVVLDNGVYASTGGQPTTSATTDLAQVAAAAGYRGTARCATRTDLSGALKVAFGTPGPHFLHVGISATGPVPPRVTDGISPTRLRERFAHWAREDA